MFLMYGQISKKYLQNLTEFEFQIIEPRSTIWSKIQNIFVRRMRPVSRSWKICKTRWPIWSRHFVTFMSGLYRMCSESVRELWNRRWGSASIPEFLPKRWTRLSPLLGWLRMVIFVPQIQILHFDFSFSCIILFSVMLSRLCALGVTIFNVLTEIFYLVDSSVIHFRTPCLSLLWYNPCLWIVITLGLVLSYEVCQFMLNDRHSSATAGYLFWAWEP